MPSRIRVVASTRGYRCRYQRAMTRCLSWVQADRGKEQSSKDRTNRSISASLPASGLTAGPAASPCMVWSPLDLAEVVQLQDTNAARPVRTIPDTQRGERGIKEFGRGLALPRLA